MAVRAQVIKVVAGDHAAIANEHHAPEPEALFDDINFQLNRFYGWVGDDSMLTEMRQAAAGVAGVQDYPTFTKIFLDLGEKALARHEALKGAYYLRLAEFFLFTQDPRKLPTRQRFVDLILGYFQIPTSAYSRIPYGSGWLPAYRLTPAQPTGHARRIRRFRQLHRGMAARRAVLSRRWLRHDPIRGPRPRGGARIGAPDHES